MAPSGRPLPSFLIGAGLKMYLSHTETIRWVRELRQGVAEHPVLRSGTAELIVLPNMLSIEAVTHDLAGSDIGVGAQDISDARRGAYTGEISADDVAALGCRYAEIGHAERRARHGESDEQVAAKVDTALKAGVTPIICVGERDRLDPDDAALWCRRQVSRALAHADPADGQAVVVAYEPIWAIGAPDPASPDHINHVCSAIAEELAVHVPTTQRRVLYGGSARPGMLDELDGSVAGLFMGRSSHNVTNVVAVLDEVGRRAA